MIPAQFQLAAKVGGVLLLMALGGGAVWWGLAPRIALEAQRADTAEGAQAEAEAMVQLQAGVLAAQQQTLGQLADIDRRMQQLGQTITRNQAASAAALEELKRHDQAVADYLAAAVPAALGVLYQRPETTDPAAYTAPPGMQPGAVPPPGPTVAGDQ